jgi:hypothetical protein
MFPNQEVLEDLQRVVGGSNNLIFHNLFKGFPISNPGRLLGIQGSMGVVEVHHNQLVCMQLSRHTYIQSDLLPAIIRAEVVQMAVADRRATLRDFSYVVGMIGKRGIIRVAPDDQIEVELYISERKNIAQLIDLSVEGVGLSLSGFLYNPNVYQLGNDLSLRFFLGSTSEKVFVPGRIVNLSKGYENFRVGVKTSPSQEARKVLTRYIVQRQKELMDELRGLFAGIYRLTTGRLGP